MSCGGRDDQTIANDDPLWRRLIPDWVSPGADGQPVISSAAFQNSPDGSPMSVTLGRDCQSHERAIGRHLGYGLASLTAGLVRGHRQVVCRDPQPEDAAHALVEGDKPRSVRKALARAAVLLVAPTRPPQA
jgi:hypothetical protein